MAGYPARLQSQDLRRADAAGFSDEAGRRIVDLLARYPNVSGVEAAEILQYLKKARYVEVERLAAEDSVRQQLDRFMKSHKEKLGYSPGDIVTAIALVVAFLAICWVLWHPIGGI